MDTLIQPISHYSQFNNFIGKSVHESHNFVLEKSPKIKVLGSKLEFSLKGALGRMAGTREVGHWSWGLRG